MSKKWKAGDHLRVARAGGVYFHHGLYVGADSVIHYDGSVSDTSGRVDDTSLADFAAGGVIELVSHKDRRYSREESVDRAYSRLFEESYSVVFNNCEHFVNWCIEGQHRSEQIERLAKKGVLVCAGTELVRKKATHEVQRIARRQVKRMVAERAVESAGQTLLSEGVKKAAVLTLASGGVAAPVLIVAGAVSLWRLFKD